MFFYLILTFKSYGKSSIEYEKQWALVFLYCSWRRTPKVITIDFEQVSFVGKLNHSYEYS